jgi:hypothetical protein
LSNFSTYEKRYFKGQRRKVCTWLTLRYSIVFLLLQEFFDGGGGLHARDIEQRLDAELCLQVCVCSVTLETLRCQEPENVPALVLGHEGRSGGSRKARRAVPGSTAVGRGVTAFPRFGHLIGDRVRQFFAVQFFEREKPDVDGVAEGAGLGAGLATRMRCGTMKLLTLSGLASPNASNVPRSVATSTLTIAV